jgi:hypothetical protein
MPNQANYPHVLLIAVLVAVLVHVDDWYCLGHYIDLYRHEETHGKRMNKKKIRARPESKMLKVGEESVDMACRVVTRTKPESKMLKPVN